MIKRTLVFENPAYLSTKYEQLVVSYPDKDQTPPKTIPIEDIGVILLESQQITITTGLLEKLMLSSVALINCDKQHMPIGLLMPLSGHSEQSERFGHQINASGPLKKNLWQQTVIAKITNQAGLLRRQGQHQELAADKLEMMADRVGLGDMQNHEAQAAAYYWPRLIQVADFCRYPEGGPPNNLLNYGYAILRGITARALVCSGLLPTFGIFHRNKYNAYCLADDIMEPYRPYIDRIVCDIIASGADMEVLTSSQKRQLVEIAGIDVVIDGKKSPLMVAMSRTTSSLHACFEGSARKILYPVLR